VTPASPPAADIRAGEVRLCFAAEDPCFAGHFPGRPLLPGVLLLDGLLAALRRARPHIGPVALEAVKFMAPVLPDQPVTLRWRETAPGQVRFEAEAEAGAARLLSGRVSWAAAGAEA
jgi:3-hydroxyacyl-[acyl-carrier-protein] dehydratase